MSKMCDIPRVKRCVSERNKGGSAKFFVNGRAVLASCKTPHTRKALFYLYFRMTKSEEHVVRDFSDTPTQLRSDECVRVMFPPVRTKFLSKSFK